MTDETTSTGTAEREGPITWKGIDGPLQLWSGYDGKGGAYKRTTVADLVAALTASPELRAAVLSRLDYPQPPPGESLHKATLELLEYANSHEDGVRLLGNVTAFHVGALCEYSLNYAFKNAAMTRAMHAESSAHDLLDKLRLAEERVSLADGIAASRLAELQQLYAAFEGSGHSPKNPREAAQAIGQMHDAEAELAAALRLAEERLAERNQLQSDLEAEQAGRMRLRQRYGAKEDETFGQFISRLKERAERLESELAEAKENRDGWKDMAERRSAQLAAERARVRELLAVDQPWPLVDTLAKLAEAANILLLDKDYDGHGWELIGRARLDALAAADRIRRFPSPQQPTRAATEAAEQVATPPVEATPAWEQDVTQRLREERDHYRDKKREGDQALASALDDVSQLKETLTDAVDDWDATGSDGSWVERARELLLPAADPVAAGGEPAEPASPPAQADYVTRQEWALIFENAERNCSHPVDAVLRHLVTMLDDRTFEERRR
jgi:hypothetical protein